MLWWLWEGVKSCGWIFDIVGRCIGLSRSAWGEYGCSSPFCCYGGKLPIIALATWVEPVGYSGHIWSLGWV
jgi:hypothetical protein